MASLLHLVLISSFPILILGCGPGTGTLGTKGTFEYEMIPPVIYTFSDDISHGQISESYAKSRLTSDVINSINEVLQANSIPLNDVTSPVVTFSPPKVTFVTDGVTKCEDANPDEYIINDAKVFYFCNAEKKKEVFTVPLTVQVTAVQSIYESQWNTLAVQVQDKLTAKRNAEFLIDPIVTVQ